MADPAVEAAQRAWRQMSSLAQSSLDVRVAARLAAREMADPIRELHKPVSQTDQQGETLTECMHCVNAYWPCQTAELAYSTEEMER